VALLFRFVGKNANTMSCNAIPNLILSGDGIKNIAIILMRRYLCVVAVLFG